MNRTAGLFAVSCCASLLSLCYSSVAFASTSSTANSLREVKHYATVHQGDTLWGLSLKYKVSVKRLESWNGLTDNSILKLGRRLIVGESSRGKQQQLSSRGESSQPSMQSAVLGLQIAQYAEQFIGTAYAWGGESTSGFDCSGLVQFSFGHFNVQLARTSFGQYSEGSAVSPSDLAPGDLVFFDTYGPGASHVGIYVGNGRFVHASSDGVRIDTLSDSYWSAHFVGSRNVLA